MRAHPFTSLARALSSIVAVLSVYGASGREPACSKTALLRPEQVSDERLRRLQTDGFDSVALTTSEEGPAQAEAQAAGQIVRAGMHLDYWIEIGRNPAMAAQHPEWMASIQTHEEWRRLFPEFGPLSSNQVVKTFPWVPVLYKEAFAAHRQRVSTLFQGRPTPRRLFLNDLQAAPSACGCGHPLCRWTPDYGPRQSATRLGDDAAAQFIAAVQRQLPSVEVIPVWATECEEHDRDTACGGVNCFHGKCWPAWSAQLEPIAQLDSPVGVLLLDRVFQHSLPTDKKSEGWIAQALAFFQQQPLRYHAQGIPARRLLPVLEGWDRPNDELKGEVEAAVSAGVSGILITFTPIDQSWTPQKFNLPPSQAPGK